MVWKIASTFEELLMLNEMWLNRELLETPCWLGEVDDVQVDRRKWLLLNRRGLFPLWHSEFEERECSTDPDDSFHFRQTRAWVSFWLPQNGQHPYEELLILLQQHQDLTVHACGLKSIKEGQMLPQSVEMEAPFRYRKHNTTWELPKKMQHENDDDPMFELAWIQALNPVLFDVSAKHWRSVDVAAMVVDSADKAWDS